VAACPTVVILSVARRAKSKNLIEPVIARPMAAAIFNSVFSLTWVNTDLTDLRDIPSTNNERLQATADFADDADSHHSTFNIQHSIFAIHYKKIQSILLSCQKDLDGIT